MRSKVLTLFVFLAGCSFQVQSSDFEKRLIAVKKEGEKCSPRSLVSFITSMGEEGSPLLRVKGDHDLEVINFRDGDTLVWSRRDCYLKILKLVSEREFGGYWWAGLDSFTDDKESFLNVGNIIVHKDAFLPLAGVLARKVTKNGQTYERGTRICVNEKGDVVDHFEVNMFNFEHTRSLYYHDESWCIVGNGRLSKDTRIEGVMWKKGTSFKFDRNGKWDHVRMVPGQKFQGKVYKNGGMLFRGNYNKYQKDYGPDDVRIRTPDEEDYDQIEVTKAY